MAGETEQRQYERIRERRKAFERRTLPWIIGIAVALAITAYLGLRAVLPPIALFGPGA